MANLGEATYRLAIDSKKFDQGIGSAKRSAKDLTGIMAGAAAALTAVSVPLIQLGRSAIMAHSELQSFNAQFTTLLGSRAAAADFVDEITRFASETPLAVAAVSQAATTLIGFGVASERVLPTLQNLGDAAQGNSEMFQRLARVYGQVNAAGRAMAEDLNQTIEAGVPIFEAIAEVMGVAAGEVKKLGEQGLITAEVYSEALRRMTEDNGLFENAMANMAETIEGKLSTLRDNLKLAQAALVEDLQPEIDAILDFAIQTAQAFTALDDEVKRSILYGAGATALIASIGAITAAALALNAAVGGLPLIVGSLVTLGAVTTGGLVGLGSYAAATREISFEAEQLEGHMYGSTEAVKLFNDEVWEGSLNLQAFLAPLDERRDALKTFAEDVADGADQVERLTASLQYQTDQYRLYGMTRIESDAAAFAAEEANRLAAEAQTAQALANMVDQYRLYGWSRVEADRMATEAIAAATKAADDDRMQRERANAAARQLLREEELAQATATNKAIQESGAAAITSIMGSFRKLEAMATSTYKATAAAARKASGEEQEALRDLAHEQYRVAHALWAFNKAAAIGMAIVNTAEAVTKTMASVPFPFNIPLAVLQGAAGALQIGVIAAQPPPPPPRLAEGGIIMRETTVVAGEAGPEAIIPLDRFPARDRQPTVVVNVQNLLGGTEEELAVRLDQALKKRAQFD